MSDIVERLRKFVTGCDRPECSRMVFTPIVCEEAADEIERLRAALRDALSYSTIGDMPVTIYENARAALKEDGDV